MAGNKENNKNNVRAGSFLKELISGSMISEKIILKNLGYIAFVTLLAALYIGNRFHAEKLNREITKLQQEVNDLRAESLSISADFMLVSKQSQVFRMVREKGLNLEEMKIPPFKLIVNKK